MDEITIREARFEDLEALYAFEQSMIETERPWDPTLKREHTNYYDLKAMIPAPHIHLVVAEHQGNAIASGYARIEEAKPYVQHTFHAYLGFMYVLPAYRGKGINKRIIDVLGSWALSQNVTELRLDVYYDNASAIKAYDKVGFSKHMIEMRRNLQK